MSRQKEFLLRQEADAWYARNREHLEQESFVDTLLFQAIDDLPKRPKRLLEVGCSSGIRLERLQKHTQGECYGIDPSSLAIAAGKERTPLVHLTEGTADSLPYPDDFFDFIWFGFCLYLCDRSLLFQIAKESDRVLRVNGAIVILDFDPPCALRNPYAHTDEPIFAHKMDHSTMFTWHPQYILSAKRALTHAAPHFDFRPDERLSFVTIIKVPE
ncbi:methyltransferase domain-containing protein, partial [Desulfovibrio sp. OttesenSCG-928-G11]|nr:methyltransferase domain-containing protein [Desulfovibrio sp. OttesenSCG-928-G11]